MTTLFSDEWIEACGAAIQADAGYRAAGRHWEKSVVLVVHGAGEGAFDRNIFFDLWRGECRAARPATANDLRNADYILSAAPDTWRQIMTEGLDPVTAIMSGRIKLDRGSLTTLTMHAGAARALVSTLRAVGDGVVAPDQRIQSERGGVSTADARRVSFVSTSSTGLRNDVPAMRLWRKAKRLGVWNPDDIDFSRDREDWGRLGTEEKDLLLRLTAMFLAGEESVTIDLLPLIMCIASEGRVEEEMFLTSFLWEEAKHVDFFHNGFLAQVAPGEGDLSRFHGSAYRRIFHQELPASMNALLTDRSAAAQARASATYNMIVEGVLAETGYHAYFSALERADLLPGLREGIGHLKRDESRHIAYGVFLLSRLIAEDRALWDVVETRMNELFPVALEMIDEIFKAYPVVPFGLQLEEFAQVAVTNFSRRMQRIERARQQTIEQIYATATAEDMDGGGANRE